MTDIPPPPPAPGMQPAYGAPQPPNNNLVWAILTTVLCCLPLGIVAIVKAAEVNSKWAAGDYAGAQASAEAAKKWSLWSAGATLILGVLYILFFVILGVASSN
ncbi:CD225/dispanin family protein [Demequina capsici]|uniref:CD225/dispanin family protein n=1 Tax=Demequina capsici TaxID=3075620 RepID=A0AA96FAA2_9MICO|nr:MULTISPECIES: CD225/dispanin family protein [unclassified Demequina]WNM23180.1 CD225/dispanin family protein [Demequina sp. OYTSA14]WNM26059.1 CD225/dispanin family protein [Demequina sp. PMTSA13]